MCMRAGGAKGESQNKLMMRKAQIPSTLPKIMGGGARLSMGIQAFPLGIYLSARRYLM